MSSQGKTLSVEFPWVLLVLRERIELSTSPLPKELGCANTLLMFKENSLFWRDVPPGFPREAC
jgi:hypothetical protein